MWHWSKRQFNAKYFELSERSHRARMNLHRRETVSTRVERFRTLAALDLMTADLFEAASMSDFVGYNLFEISAYSRAARERRTSAREWRDLAEACQAGL